MKRPKVIAIIVGIVLLAIVILQNTETVDTRVLFLTLSMPRAVLLFLTAALGFAIGLFYSSFIKRRQSNSAKNHSKS